MEQACVDIVEVSPRDGLQNEPAELATPDKAELVRRAFAFGARRVEAVSFVSPRHVPKMADAEGVLAELAPSRAAGGVISALVVNLRGVERAIGSGVDELTGVVVCSETFSLRNQGVGIAESLDMWADMAATGKAAGLKMSITLAAAFGCPFEGEIAVGTMVRIAERVAATEPASIALADTIGVAVPRDVRERVAAVREVTGKIPLRAHFHDTRNTGIANALTAIEYGVEQLDASLGGIGGCPFAPAATGNIATEDLIYALTRSGVTTGLDLGRAIEAAGWLEVKLGKSVPSKLLRAGDFGTAARSA